MLGNSDDYKCYVYRNGQRLYDGVLMRHGVYVSGNYVYMQPYHYTGWPILPPHGRFIQRCLARLIVEYRFLVKKMKGDYV